MAADCASDRGVADAELPARRATLELALGALLGSGTSGEVSPILGAIDGGRYAVKEVRLTSPAQEALRGDDSLLQEVRLHRLCSEECSAVVRYVFAHATGDSLFVVMEACDSELWGVLVGEEKSCARLAAWHGEDDRLSEADRWSLTGDLCEAVRHCHSLRVLHRDVNPWNVFVVRGRSANRPMSARLGDFGLALQLPEDVEELHGLTSAGGTDLDASALGSLYSAPELGSCYGFPADAFSLGMTLLAIWAAALCSGDEGVVAVTESAKKAAASGIMAELGPAALPLAVLLWLLRADPATRPTTAVAAAEVAHFRFEGMRATASSTLLGVSPRQSKTEEAAEDPAATTPPPGPVGATDVKPDSIKVGHRGSWWVCALRCLVPGRSKARVHVQPA